MMLPFLILLKITKVVSYQVNQMPVRWLCQSPSLTSARPNIQLGRTQLCHYQTNWAKFKIKIVLNINNTQLISRQRVPPLNVEGVLTALGSLYPPLGGNKSNICNIIIFFCFLKEGNSEHAMAHLYLLVLFHSFFVVKSNCYVFFIENLQKLKFSTIPKLNAAKY